MATGGLSLPWHWLPLSLLFALAFAVRLSVVLQLHGHPLLQPVGLLDSGVSVDLGAELANGDLLLRGATAGQPFFFAPLYVYFLGVVFALGGTRAGGSGRCRRSWAARRSGCSRARRGPGSASRRHSSAGVLLALTGPVVFHEAILLQSALDPFLTALALLAVGRAASRPAAASAAAGARLALGGAAIGLLRPQPAERARLGR